MSKKNKSYQITLKDDVALKFLGKINSCGNYRVSSEKRDEINAYKLENGSDMQILKLKETIKKEFGIPDDKLDIAVNSRLIWDKSRDYSMKIDNPYTVKNVKVKTFIDVFLEGLKDYSPKYPKIKRKKLKDPHLLVIDIADLHINKFCQLFMTGATYDSNVAVERALEGVEGILKKSVGFDIEKIVFVIGNDVLNTDGKSKATTNGTPQDTDLHWWQAFKIAKMMYVKSIETCLSVADVEVIHCPSNHDFHLGTCLADSLVSWFRFSKNVTFQDSPRYRKYYRYHKSMLEFEHGDKGKPSNVPLLMAQEEPRMWAETKYRYSYLHHVHHSDITKYQSSKDYIGANVTFLRSPSSPDIWHAESGYINLVAIEGFIHSRDNGRVSHLTHYF